MIGLFQRLLLGVPLFTGAAVDAAQAERWLVGNAADVTPAESPTGGLMLMGGGGDVDEAFQWFLGHAAGGDIVVLRSSGSDGYNDYLGNELGVAVDSVETLLLTRRAQSYDADVIKTLTQAEGIFIAGGDQSNYIRFWQDTPVMAALNAHVAAGKPLGGTSAGLAVMGGYVYTAMHESDLTSRLALREPDSRLLTFTDQFLQLPFLEQVLTDSHFSDRARMGRLLVMLHRLAQARGGRAPLGLGVDERTALGIEPSGMGRVFAAEGGQAHIVSIIEFDPATPDGLVAAVFALGSASAINFNSYDIQNPVQQLSVRIEGTRLRAVETP